MSNNDTDNKIPIYQLKSKEKVLEYYVDWTKEGQFNKDMSDWNYQAPQNTVKLFDQHTPNKNINIFDAGCGSGLVGIELQKYGYSKITGADFSEEMLKLIPNTQVNVIERCSGHGGSWGIMKNNFETALKVGKPVARETAKIDSSYVVSECLLARDHILQGVERLDNEEPARTPEQVQHPIELMAISYKD